MRSYGLLVCLIFISLASFGQSNIVKFQPVPLVNGILSLGYERKISPSGSLQFNFDYAGERDFGFKDSWVGLGAEYRVYNLIPALKLDPVDEAPNGFFVAPTLGLRFFRSIDEEDPDSEFTEKYSFLNLGAIAGYQYLPKFKNGTRPLSLEASVGLVGGLMLNADRFDYEDYQLWPRFNIGLVPVVNVGIGFAFGK